MLILYQTLYTNTVSQERDIHALHEELGWYSYTRFSNPTGHYELNLTTAVHQALCTRLKVGWLVGVCGGVCDVAYDVGGGV